MVDTAIPTMTIGLTVEQLLERIQEGIESGKIAKADPVGVCNAFNPIKEYFLLADSDGLVTKHGDITIILY